jgi:pimeloyl-ACP methyl ester carboxylesterase
MRLIYYKHDMIRRYSIRCILALSLAALAVGQTQAPRAPADVKPGSITFEDVACPYPVSYLPLRLYGQHVDMAYMDVPPAGPPNGRTVVLFHGMNFGGFYFGGPIDLLRNEGFRVVVPDQIGFGRSSKPVIPYHFQDMALNSRTLLKSLGIARAVIVGHSMGGMLAARFAASYPDVTERVVIYNPIGLTDPRWDRPWTSTEDLYKAMVAQTHDQVYAQAYGTIKRYFATSPWRPEYDQLVRIMYAPSLSADWPRYAMVRTMVGQMVYLDPVVYDWAHIKSKALVVGGDKDGPDFPERAKHIADTIPGAQLVLIPGAGHVPHIEVPEVFNRELLKFLKSDNTVAATSAATSSAR